MKIIQALSTVVAFCLLSEVQGATLKDLLSQSEPSVQATLKTIAADLNQLSGDRDKIDALQIVDKLRSATNEEHEMVRQLAIFSVAPGEQQPLISLAVLNLLDLPPSVVIESLSPYLNAENIKLRSFVRDWFQSHDNSGSDATPLTPVNFEDYEDYLRKKFRNKESIPPAFSEYIFERSPSRALISFNRADKRSKAADRLKAMRIKFEQEAKGIVDQLPKPKAGFGANEIRLAEHQISNAIWLKQHDYGEQFQRVLPEAQEQVQALAKQDLWWVRLYAVEIMRRHREFREPKVLEKLASDSNELVSRTANSAIE